MDREKVEAELDAIVDECRGCDYVRFAVVVEHCTNILALLKEPEDEYGNGFNDAMQCKRELMYEGTDGKWHKKDW